MKLSFIKIALVIFGLALFASCRGPKECWGVSSEAMPSSTVDVFEPAN